MNIIGVVKIKLNAFENITYIVLFKMRENVYSTKVLNANRMNNNYV